MCQSAALATQELLFAASEKARLALAAFDKAPHQPHQAAGRQLRRRILQQEFHEAAQVLAQHERSLAPDEWAVADQHCMDCAGAEHYGQYI